MEKPDQKKKILIATGIYPPDVGGPANYAKSLNDAFLELGHKSVVKTYSIEKKLPSGVRHFVYFVKILPSILLSDFVVALDTFSVGLPAVFAAKLFRKKIILRTGGDFLWEQYVERTGEKILLSDFYKQKREYTTKEKIIFSLTKKILNMCDKVVFSTTYQQKIFIDAYSLDIEKTALIENFYGERKRGIDPIKTNFVCFVRDLRWKNIRALKHAFEKAKLANPNLTLEIEHNISRDEVLNRLETCYAGILVSLGDISPNFVLEGLMFGKPFILTKENGLKDRIGDIALYADPLSIDDITEKIVYLANNEMYKDMKNKIREFSFTHSYTEIAEELLGLLKNISK